MYLQEVEKSVCPCPTLPFMREQIHPVFSNLLKILSVSFFILSSSAKMFITICEMSKTQNFLQCLESLR